VRCTDRRLLLRVAAATSGGWTLIWGPADRGPVLPVLDLSAGGAACALPPGLELGSAEAEVWVHLPGTAPITASAELRRRWTHQGQRMVGLAFGPMAPAHLARLTGALLRAHPA
jgi:c-di-GMP-binding flagellar brake protein YcgR